MRTILVLALISINLPNIKAYSSYKHLFDEDTGSKSINTHIKVTNEEFFINLLVKTKWAEIENELFQELMKKSIRDKENQEISSHYDFVGIINLLIYKTNDQKAFKQTVENLMESDKPEYFEYFWARCNQIIRAAQDKGGFKAIREKSLEDYKRLIKDTLRKPLEFHELSSAY